MGKIRERAERLDAEPGLIQLGFDREQRAAFDPAVPDAQVFRKTVLVVGGAQELVGFPQARPVFFGERGVAAFDHVIVHGNEVEWRGIGGGVGIRIALEPVDKSGALRNFVRDLAVVALEFADECQSGTYRGKIAGGVQGERGPEGIAAEKPGEARALGLARSAVAGNKPGAEIRIADPSLELADARPIVSLLQLRVGKLKADRAREIDRKSVV